MASKLKIIPLGGLGEIGKNLTIYEYGKDMFLVDCGMGFPDQDLYGVDLVIPDISYLKANKNRIRGMVITHGHEDHIGAIPYVLKQLDMPIYATPLTAAIIELKLEEHDLLYHTQIFTKKPGDKFKLGCFEIEFIHTNHSIADSVALAIKTPIGTVIHTGDFKIDLTPIQGGMIDLPRLGQLGNEGVLALLSDSTNVERPGYCASEARVIDCFDELFKDCNKRIIVTTFASNVHRLQQIINVAAKYKRKVGITGRSMENIMRVATELGYVDIPDGVMMDMSQIGSLPRSKTVIVCTGAMTRSIGCKNEAKYVGKGISYCAVCDANFFEDFEIYVVGGNGIAAEESLYLAGYARKVTMIHKGPALTVSPMLKERLDAEPKIHVLCNEEVEDVGGDELLSEIVLKNTKTGEETVLHADEEDGFFGLFGFTGKKTTGMFDGVLDMEGGYIKTDECMRTNIPGVFAAGDVRVTPLRQVVTACADGAIAAMQCYKYISAQK